MKFHYKGKFNGDPDSLPHGEHKPGAVAFREPETPRKLAIVANALAFGIVILCLAILYARGGFRAFSILGVVLATLTMFPHEMLHALCFKEDVYMYTNLKQGMLFVVGPETMSRRRFVVMSLLPNIVFGLIPFLIFLIWPEMGALGTMGAICLSMGAGDFMNVYHAMLQMPKGARTYLYKFNSFWYMPGADTEGEDTLTNY